MILRDILKQLPMTNYRKERHQTLDSFFHFIVTHLEENLEDTSHGTLVNTWPLLCIPQRIHQKPHLLLEFPFILCHLKWSMGVFNSEPPQ